MSTIEPPAQFFHKEFEVLDKSLVMNDDLLTEVELENGVVDEEIVQMELKEELISTKVFSDPVAHQVFDEMPRMMASHGIKFDMPMLSGVASSGAMVKQPNPLPSNFNHDKVVFDPGTILKEEWKSEAEIDAMFYRGVAHDFPPGFVVVDEDLKEKLKLKAYKEAKMNL